MDFGVFLPVVNRVVPIPEDDPVHDLLTLKVDHEVALSAIRPQPVVALIHVFAVVVEQPGVREEVGVVHAEYLNV